MDTKTYIDTYCVYGHGEEVPATGQCSNPLCNRPLCSVCGYREGEERYCNYCWSLKEKENGLV